MAKRSRKVKQQSKKSNLWIFLTAGAVVVIGIILAVVFLKPGGADTAGLPSTVSVSQAADLRDQGAFILDVRTHDEWVDYHMPGSTLIPLDELPNRLNELPRDQKIVVVCRSGNRSASGRDILLNAGFTRVTSMTGGLSTWRDQGYPTTTGSKCQVPRVRCHVDLTIAHVSKAPFPPQWRP